ncbi:MAG: universal stress protein [Streptosporangiales bacterium]|nr:universal stress protein [Streptosporangiales bacterium]
MAGAILVGVDGSEQSVRALDWAVAEARLRGTSALELLFAVGVPALDLPLTGWYEQAAGHARDVLAENAERIRGLGLTVETTVVPEVAAPALINRAEQAALTVVGLRGRGGFPGLRIGSVAYQVAAHAPGPVAVIGPEQPNGRPESEVVCGIDGSDQAQGAIAAAMEAASLRGRPLRVVHAWRHPSALGPGDMLSLVYDVRLEQQEQEAQLAEAMAGWSAKYPDVRVITEVLHDSPVRALTEASAGSELLVVGPRGRRGFPLLALGSVAHGVLHHASCPVLIARRRPA